MLTFVVGTRPEAIKVAPVVTECRKLSLPCTVIHTGQHTDLLLGTGLTPDLSFTHVPATENIADWVEQCRHQFTNRLGKIVVVQGDTMSVHAAVLQAQLLGVSIYHIEAGVRSGDHLNPWPEEGIRGLADEMAGFGSCSTPENLRNVVLQRGAEHSRHFKVLGNPGIDALFHVKHPIPYHERLPQVVVTLHRRESWGEPLREMAETIVDIAGASHGLTFFWPAHPSKAVQDALPRQKPPNLKVLAPLRHREMAEMLAQSLYLITDSGGLQEEAAAYGIPALICRDVTDRPESVASGQALVVGRTAEGLWDGWNLRSTLSTVPSTVFGDGQSAPRIAHHLAECLTL